MVYPEGTLVMGKACGHGYPLKEYPMIVDTSIPENSSCPAIQDRQGHVLPGPWYVCRMEEGPEKLEVIKHHRDLTRR